MSTLSVCAQEVYARAPGSVHVLTITGIPWVWKKVCTYVRRLKCVSVGEHIAEKDLRALNRRCSSA